MGGRIDGEEEEADDVEMRQIVPTTITMVLIRAPNTKSSRHISSMASANITIVRMDRE